MNKAIIYCRKSTDREEKQQNSIESQMNACMRTIENNHLTLVDSFIESASAKKSGKRPIFESMLSLCKKWKIDYIVVDEASRLSRNNTDSAKILGLLEEGHIKWILTTSQKYYWEQASELFMLLLSFGMAKFDNDTRARNVKARMITCAEKWRCLGKAPFWYKNVTILKDGQVSRKWIIKDPLFSTIVQRIFRMRWEEKKSLTDISSICIKEYSTLGWKHKFSVQGLEKLLSNPFYIWMIRYAWKTYTGEHEAIISTSLFEKVSKLERWFYIHDKEELSPLQFLYKGRIKDSFWISLTAEAKKGKYIYYRNQSLRSTCTVNISQSSIDESIILKLKDFSFPVWLYEHCLKLWKEVIDEKNKNLHAIESEIDKEIALLWEKEKRLVNGYLEWILEWSAYKETQRELNEKITILEAQKKEIKKIKIEDMEKKLREMFELIENLSERYKLGNHETKYDILQKTEFELFINNKKELVIQENKLFSDIKMLNFNDGNATENRTPITGMRIPCPNR